MNTQDNQPIIKWNVFSAIFLVFSLNYAVLFVWFSGVFINFSPSNAAVVFFLILLVHSVAVFFIGKWISVRFPVGSVLKELGIASLLTAASSFSLALRIEPSFPVIAIFFSGIGFISGTLPMLFAVKR